MSETANVEREPLHTTPRETSETSWLYRPAHARIVFDAHGGARFRGCDCAMRGDHV